MKWFKSEKPAFVHNKQEFLSLWALAHAWEGLDPDSTDPRDIPASIQSHLDMLMLAFFRQEFQIRQANGYRLIGYHLLHVLLGLDRDFEKLRDNLVRKRPLDKTFLDKLYVMRSDILRWCEKEYRDPPPCWMPASKSVETPPAEEEADDNDDWYEKLSPLRKERVACLEVAKHLWEQNPTLKYEQVRMHPVMEQAGLRYVFTAERFKNWARRIAPDEAKRGGRRPQSSS